MITIREQLEKLAALIGGKAWGLDKGKPRIYMPSRRDCKVYFDFPAPAYASPEDEINGAVDLGGAALRVYIDDCGQHPNWYASQKAKMIAARAKDSLAIQAAQSDDWELAQVILDFDDDLDVDDISNHLTNGRLAEARAMLTTEDALQSA